MSSSRMRRAVPVALAVLGLAFGASACGSDDDEESASAGGSSSATVAGSDSAAVLDKYYEGVVDEAPAEGPAAQSGKTIWFSNCVAFEGCARFGDGVMEAAKVLGWNIKVVDNKNDPQKSIAIIRQAVAAKADGIIDTLSDCANIKTGLEVAKKAGVPVVTYAGLDCDNPAVKGGGPSLYAAPTKLGKSADSLAYYENQGAADAEFLVALAASKGIEKPKFLTAIPQGQLFQEARQKGFDAKLAELCSDCEATPIKFTVLQLASKGQQIIKSAILKSPDADVFYYPNDAFLPLGIQTALEANKGTFKILCCGDGGKLSTDNVRKNELAETVAANFSPLEMWAWGTLDVLNRAIAGEQPADVPAQANITYYFDKEHNLPASGAVEVPYDYVKAYSSIWKGSGE